MVKRPDLSVRAARLTLPEMEVATTATFSSGASSVPDTRPRITSTFWADADAAAMVPRSRARRRSRRRMERRSDGSGAALGRKRGVAGVRHRGRANSSLRVWRAERGRAVEGWTKLDEGRHHGRDWRHRELGVTGDGYSVIGSG